MQEPYEIIDLEQLTELKYLLKKKFGQAFCTNVLRVALNHKEEMVASNLIAYYKVELDDKMIIRALKTN